MNPRIFDIYCLYLTYDVSNSNEAYYLMNSDMVDNLSLCCKAGNQQFECVFLLKEKFVFEKN